MMNEQSCSQLVGEIIAGDLVAQTFVAGEDYLSGISIPMCTYNRRVETTLVFRLYQIGSARIKFIDFHVDTSPIAQKEINANILFDGEEYDFYFPVIKLSKGELFCISISSPNSSAGNAVSVLERKRPLDGVSMDSFLHGLSSSKYSIEFTPRYSPPVADSMVPSNILYSPVSQCNLNCIHCISRESRKKFYRMPIASKELLKNLSQQKKIHRIATDYSGDIFFADHKYGGELDYLIDLDVDLAIDTNGHFMDRGIAEKLLLSRLKYINFSLDAGTAETYAKVRRGSRPLDEIVNNIRIFSEIRDEMEAFHVTMVLSFALMKMNLHEFNHVIDFAAELNASAVYGNHLQVYTDDMEYESLFNHKEYYNDFRKSILDYASQKKVVVHLPRPFETRPNRTGHRYCSLPWNSAAILANGDVMACCVPSTVMGNLNENSLKEIWNGKVYQKFRASVNSDDPPDVCKFCPMFRFDNNENSYFFNRVRHGMEDYRDIVG